MDANAINAALEVATKGGTLAMVVAILYGGYKGIWVWGKDFRKMEETWVTRYAKMEDAKDKWEAMALRLMGSVERSQDVAAKAVATVKEGVK